MLRIGIGISLISLTSVVNWLDLL